MRNKWLNIKKFLEKWVNTLLSALCSCSHLMSKEDAVIIPFYTWENWKAEKLNSLHKITQLVSNRGKFEWKRFDLTTYTPNILLF